MKNKFLTLLLVFSFTNLIYFAGNTQGPQDEPKVADANTFTEYLRKQDSMRKAEKRQEDSITRAKDSINNSTWKPTEFDSYTDFKEFIVNPKKNILKKNTEEQIIPALKSSVGYTNTVGYRLGFWIGLGKDAKDAYNQTSDALKINPKYIEVKPFISPLLRKVNTIPIQEKNLSELVKNEGDGKGDVIKYTLIITDNVGVELSRTFGLTNNTYGVIPLPLFEGEIHGKFIFENINQMTALKVLCNAQLFKYESPTKL